MEAGHANEAGLDPGEVGRRWRVEGFSCGLWVDPPGQVWEGYVHAVDERVLLLAGEVEFEFEGQVHRPGVGEELLIPANARHTVRNVGRGESRWLYGYAR